MTKHPEMNRRTVLGSMAFGLAATAAPAIASAQSTPGKAVNLDDYTLVFEDNFETLNLNDSPATDLVAPRGWVPVVGDGANPGSEIQRYVDPRNPAMKGHSPFSVKDSILSISAEPTPADIAGPALNNRRLISGMMNTRGWFRQQYGYIEARLKMPKGAIGNWPAFWALSEAGTWPPEIDIIEQVSTDVRGGILTIHTTAYPNVGKTQLDTKASVPDMSADFHVFGVDWQPDGVRYYLDGKFILQVRPTNGLVSAEVTSGGTGYTSPPTVKIVGGGGDGASVRAEVAGGKVTRIVIDNSGKNFRSSPTLAFEGTGTGAVARVIAATNDPALPIDLHTPMYLILNLAMGAPGSWPGATDLAAPDFPRRFEVDYIRVYKKKHKAPALLSGPQPETIALADRMAAVGAPLREGRRALVNDLIAQLKSWTLRYDTEPFGNARTEWDTSARSLWQALDALYVFAAHDRSAALVNWVTPGRNDGVLVGQPTFNRDRGFAFRGQSDHYIETGFVLSSARQYRPRDNHLGMWINEDITNAFPAPAMGSTASTIRIGAKALDYQLASAPPGGGLAKRPLPKGHVVAARGYYNQVAMFQNGAIWHCGSVDGNQAILPAATETMKIGTNARGIEGIATELGVAHWGRRLMPDEAAKLHELLGTFLAALKA